MREKDRALNMLGLCMKAGFVQSGAQACEAAVKSGRARLALIDGGASENAKKALADACHNRGVPLVETPAEALGTAIGKPGRMAAAIMDGNFAARIETLFRETDR